MKKLLILCIAILTGFVSCQPKANIQELFETDIAFSNAATELGFNIAFIEFAHIDAVLLRKNSFPIEGKQKIAKLFEKANTEGVQFFWEPINGDIAKSGDLGFTYGTYTLKMDTLAERGTYVSVWKKDKQGNWKYILDSGNEGLE